MDLTGKNDIVGQGLSSRLEEDVTAPGLREFVVDLREVVTFDGFVQAFNQGFCIPNGGRWKGNSWNAFHDYFSWPNEEHYRLKLLGFEDCRGLSSQDRDMIEEILTDNSHVVVAFD